MGSYYALSGLAIVGACNEHETGQLHRFGAVSFYGAQSLYMVIDALWGNVHWRGARRLLGAFFAAVFTARALAPVLLDGVEVYENIESYLEWAGLAAFIGYMNVSVRSYPDAAVHVLAILQEPTAAALQGTASK